MKKCVERDMKKRISLYWKMIIAGIVLILLLNVAARFHVFCDWYVEYIFPIFVNSYGGFSNLFSFSVGECLIIVAIFLLIIAIISGGLFCLLKKREKYREYVKNYYKFCLAVLICVMLVMTLNCGILYNCSYMDSNPKREQREYTIEELEHLRNYLVQQCNTLSKQIERDDRNRIVYNGDLQKEAKKAMLKISREYNRLDGFYPDAKPLAGSRFMSLTNIAGVYFPFSMEANYNSEMYVTMFPTTFCHEYAHLKGYIYEDEANFIGYLACIESDDIFFQYCGYLFAYDYVDAAYYEIVGEDERYFEQIALNALADWDDLCWLMEDAEEEVYMDAEETFLNADNLTGISDTITDAELKLSGVEDGIASYDRVVELILHYYDGELY